MRPVFVAADSGADRPVCRFRVTSRLTACFAAALLPRLSGFAVSCATVFFVAAPLVAGFVAFRAAACLRPVIFGLAAALFFAVTVFFAAVFLADVGAPALRGLVTRRAAVFVPPAAFFVPAAGLVVRRSVALARVAVARAVPGSAVRLAGFFGAALPLIFLGLAARGAAESFDGRFGALGIGQLSLNLNHSGEIRLAHIPGISRFRLSEFFM